VQSVQSVQGGARRDGARRDKTTRPEGETRHNSRRGRRKQDSVLRNRLREELTTVAGPTPILRTPPLATPKTLNPDYPLLPTNPPYPAPHDSIPVSSGDVPAPSGGWVCAVTASPRDPQYPSHPHGGEEEESLSFHIRTVFFISR